MIKICKKCNIAYEYNEHNFHKNKFMRSGLQIYCKTCRNRDRQSLRQKKKIEENLSSIDW